MTDERVWFTLMLQERSGTESPWRWTFETILRSRDGLQALDLLSLRPTVLYDLTNRSSVGGGYAFSPSFPASGGTTVEHRLFEQFMWSARAGLTSFSARFRLEQRFIESNSGVLWRLRQQYRVARQLGSSSRFALTGYDELFLHLNDTARSPSGVDQNRIFGGLSITLAPRARIEAGYLNQYSPGHGRPARMNHVLSSVATIAF